MPIIPERLRELRKRKNLTREKLAELSRISYRQLSRLEDNAKSSNKPRELTIKSLARVLGVEPGVLTGDSSMPECKSRDGERVPFSTVLLPEVRLAYALIKRRYGINPTAVVNMAPLLFTLMAEGSFAWRREKLNEVQEAAEKLQDLGGGHLSFAFSAYRALDASVEEERSICKLDLFGEHASDDTFDLGYNRDENNPFADYLRELANKIDKPDVVDISDSLICYGILDSFPFHEVCATELSKVTGGSRIAAHVLKNGYARLTDIPDELWAKGATESRVKWLEEKLPEELKTLFDDSIEILLNPTDDENRGVVQ